ncbi:MAG: ribonuclease III, partial [Acidobacteria bacterium]|nr:ribonuclease III [Acidobacteriota bacterium]
IGEQLTQAGLQDDLLEDYKSALQELLGARRLPPPKYLVVQEQGPQHRKTFTIEVRIGSDFSAQADGPTKKAAAQQAARLALEHVRSKPGLETAPAAAGEKRE